MHIVSCSHLVSAPELRADRFRSWRDFAVRLRGAGPTAALAAALDGSATAVGDAKCVPSRLSFAVNAPTSFCPLAFALRAPLPGRFGVASALGGFFDDPSLRRYTVACAYLDHAGAALLQRALRRGAAVTLIMPATPNVYGHANAAALCRLLADDAAAPSGRLTALLHPAMVHAKAAVGFRTDGTAVALIGSANLKERSLTQFGELLMRCEGGAFTARLAAALARLAAEGVLAVQAAAAPRVLVAPQGYIQHARPLAVAMQAAPAPQLPQYVPVLAALEEWLG